MSQFGDMFTRLMLLVSAFIIMGIGAGMAMFPIMLGGDALAILIGLALGVPTLASSFYVLWHAVRMHETLWKKRD